MILLPVYILYPAIFLIALFLCAFAIPRIIYVAKRKKLYDAPDNIRKLHLTITPNLGGIGIFFSFVIACLFFVTPELFPHWNYFVLSCIILFIAGINDDLVGITPKAKFFAQFVAAFITIKFADIRISSLHGIFGIYELPEWISIAFTVVGCMFVTNALNLIDGIDGLAGSIGVLATFSLGMCLAFTGHIGEACMAFCLMGSLFGFLHYNIAPAKVFMGDTGSLFIGFTISILSIEFIHAFSTKLPIAFLIHTHKGALIVALSILFVPVFDSFRVFLNRMRKGGSPFKADRSHLHHYLLDAGFTHGRAVGILVTSNILLITVALLVQDADPNIALGSVITLSLALFTVLYYTRKRKLARNQEIISQRRRNADIQMSGDSAFVPAGTAM